jgi:CspA family cold shock protein
MSIVTGTVKFLSLKGFGFLAVDGGPDVFFHVHELQRCGITTPIVGGERLSFEIVERFDKTQSRQHNFACVMGLKEYQFWKNLILFKKYSKHWMN